VGQKVFCLTHSPELSCQTVVVKALEEGHNAKDVIWGMRSPGLWCTIDLSEMLERCGTEVEILKVQKCSNIVRVCSLMRETADAVDQLCPSALGEM
jgi:hypothetical protein